MNFETLAQAIQRQFGDGLVFVIGSGLSAAEGIPGMPKLTEHLTNEATALSGEDAARWSQIAQELHSNAGLEAALLKHPPTNSLEEWIVRETCELIIPAERRIVGEVFRGERTLRLTKLLSKLHKPSAGLPIVTPNYDRLIELACEQTGYHVDTTAVGHFSGEFNHEKSCLASVNRIVTSGKLTRLEHFPRAVVLKPHGSLDWYRTAAGARRCAVDISAERLIVTPGLNKYRMGYNEPFDQHRELANAHIRKANRLVIVGFGFNDDHLETHLLAKIRSGAPTLILSRSISDKVRSIVQGATDCLALSALTDSDGIEVTTKSNNLQFIGKNLWDIGTLAEELLT